MASLLSSSSSSLSPIELTGRHHRPDDPSQLVGDGDSDDHGPTPFEQIFDPATSDAGPCLWIPNDVARPDDKQVPEIGTPCYAAEPVLPDGGILLRRQAQPSRESLPERNMVGSGTVAATAVAVMGPTPGIEDGSLAIGFTLWI